MALFGNDKSPAASGGSRTPTSNLLAEGTRFEGTLTAESDVNVSGHFIGTLIIDGRAFVAPSGAVEGEIQATNADVAGAVQGDVYVAERLVLKSTARVDGTIHTRRLVVEEGALFSGDCTMGDDAVMPGARPGSAPAPDADEAATSPSGTSSGPAKAEKEAATKGNGAAAKTAKPKGNRPSASS